MSNLNSVSNSGSLWLLRHADRSRFESDSLSEFGMNQAQSLYTVFEQRGHGFPDLIVSSPRKRTQATVAPLIGKVSPPPQLIIDEDLEERRATESASDFRRRVHEVLSKTCLLVFENKTARSVLMVSHIDWLIEATDYLNSSEPIDLKNAPFQPFELRGYRQKFKGNSLERI